MLSVHVLNAGKGDSIVLEHRSAQDVRSFGVIDSNSYPGVEPPALVKLRALGAQSLSFVALTHPHADHYTGLSAILRDYAGRIGTLLTFPLRSDKSRIDALIKRYAEHVKNGGLPDDMRESTMDLVRFLREAKNHPDWHSPHGYDGAIVVDGFSGVVFRHVLPPSRMKGSFFHGLDEGTLALEAPHANDLSFAFSASYAGVRILFGADGTQAVWAEQGRYVDRGAADFKADIVKIPHHGSGTDCNSATLNRIFRDDPNRDVPRFALISANGTSHPSPAVLSELMRRGIKPYCTNVAEICATRPGFKASVAAGLTPALGRLIDSIATKDQAAPGTPCQGSITVNIDPAGNVDVVRELNNRCAFRGEYAGIFN